MPALSLAMIVKNEAACIRDCLAGAARLAGEIVIGDTGSTDETAGIAAEYGARVVPVPWQGDFAAARNRVLEEVRGDWVLHLDADEVLDGPAAEAIRRLVDADGVLEPGQPPADAFELTLANYCDDCQGWRWKPAPPGDPMARGHAGYIPVPLLRLFRAGRGYEYRGRVHENITESVTERGGRIEAAPVLIHHYGYAAAQAKRQAKSALYLDIARANTAERPADPKAWHDLAELALSCGLVPEAESACRQALALQPAVAPAMTLATILLNRGDLEEADAILQQLAWQDAAPAHALAALGAIALRRGRLEESAEWLDTALRREPDNIIALLYRARMEDCRGEFERAGALLDAAAALAPALADVTRRVQAHAARADADAHRQAGRHPQACQLYVQALKLDPDDPMGYCGLAAALGGMGITGKAREMYANALRLVDGLPMAAKGIRELG